MALLLIDNYDSFTCNIVELLRRCDVHDVLLVKNDSLEPGHIEQADRIIISPGPGIPQELPSLIELIKKVAETKKILGICLGFQILGVAFGAEMENLKMPYHGMRKKILVKEADKLFQHLPASFYVGLYHSWYLPEESLTQFHITAATEQNIPMAIRHKTFDVCGVLFHPESYMTAHGRQLMNNWLKG